MFSNYVVRNKFIILTRNFNKGHPNITLIKDILIKYYQGPFVKYAYPNNDSKLIKTLFRDDFKSIP